MLIALGGHDVAFTAFVSSASRVMVLLFGQVLTFLWCHGCPNVITNRVDQGRGAVRFCWAKLDMNMFVMPALFANKRLCNHVKMAFL